MGEGVGTDPLYNPDLRELINSIKGTYLGVVN